MGSAFPGEISRMIGVAARGLIVMAAVPGARPNPDRQLGTRDLERARGKNARTLRVETTHV